MTRAFLIAMLAAILLVFQPVLPQRLADGMFSAVAWADEDDDDGGSDDDDDDGGGGGGWRGGGGWSGGGQGSSGSFGGVGGNARSDDDDGGLRTPSSGGGWERLFGELFGWSRQLEPAAAPTPAPPPAATPNEIVALALNDADLATLIAQGFTVIEERALPGFGTVSRRLAVPPGLTLEEARDAARAMPSGQDADFNHFYRPEQVEEGEDVCPGPDCPDSVLRDWPYGLPRDTVCGPGAPIGMIDTGINEDHEAFAGAQLEVTRLGREDLEPSRAIHGTAIAALLVGQQGSRAPGLLPGTRLVAVDAFHRVGSDERADVFSLIEGLDLLASESVSVINLSLAGPPNSVLEAVVERLVNEDDIVLVSSVGNDGPAAEPAYPAAYEFVIAVTAVNQSGSAYRRAVRGAHVDLAAPGVEVWTAASVSGARWKTGTSFAVPFVTAAAALVRAARPDLAATEVAEELQASAIDVGEPGRDEVFGAGIINLDSICSR